MAFFRFALLAGLLLDLSEAGSRQLKIRAPSTAAIAEAPAAPKKRMSNGPFQLVEGGESDGTPTPDLNLIGEVDEVAQQDEAERGRPIEEDNYKHKTAAAPAKATKPQAVHAEPLQKGMEKADPAHQKKTGAYNPITGQVESLLQVNRKSDDVDEEVLEDLDEDDAAIVRDDADAETEEETEESSEAEEDDSEEAEESGEAEEEQEEQDDAEASDAIKEEAEDMEREDEEQEASMDMDDSQEEEEDDAQEEQDEEAAEDSDEQDAEESSEDTEESAEE